MGKQLIDVLLSVATFGSHVSYSSVISFEIVTMPHRIEKAETPEDNGLITQPSFKHFISLRLGDKIIISCAPAGSRLTPHC